MTVNKYSTPMLSNQRVTLILGKLCFQSNDHSALHLTISSVLFYAYIVNFPSYFQ